MNAPPALLPPIEDYLRDAEAWLSARVSRRTGGRHQPWGEGTIDVAVFQTLSEEEEERQIEASRAWQRSKSAAGYGSISWPSEYGGAGLPRSYEEAFRRLERGFDVPALSEAVGISLNIEAPSIRVLGSDHQRARYLAPLRRADLLCCQLFSEPQAGSDLGSMATRAERRAGGWVVNGQKVWTTGAQFADLGYLIARTDSSARKQEALTAFLVPMDLPGIEVRPLRQLTGGTSFNEVFLTDVQIGDDCVLGEVGGGWQAMMTTLGFERVAGVVGPPGGSTGLFDRLVQLARHLGSDQDPLVRQELARAYADARVRAFTNRRAAESARAGQPGPEGSIGKLGYTNGLTHLAQIASLLLGPRLTADGGEWGTYCWTELVLGAPGMRIAGGTDEIQRNTIAERVLGLPREDR